MLDKSSKIYVAGHRGLVGSAIWNNLLRRGYTNLVGRTHKDLDLTDQYAVKKFFDEEQPDAVVLAAAFVGGIMANSLYRADFLMMNMKIQCNVISEAYAHDVKKLLFLGSTCIYPKNALQPMKEDCLLTSELEYTNEEYACQDCWSQDVRVVQSPVRYQLYCRNAYQSSMVLMTIFIWRISHVMPAMMRKVYLAKLINDGNWEAIRKDLNIRPVGANIKENRYVIDGNSSEAEILKVLSFYGIEHNKVNLWGTGKPLREFLWSEDMADASVHVLLNVNFSDIIGIEKYSSVHYGNKADGVVDRNHSTGRGGAIPSLGEIRNCHINVGTGKEITICELSELVVKAVGFTGTVEFDTAKPDGTMRKLIDVSKLHFLGWTHKVDIEDGVQKLFEWYEESIS